MEWVKLNFKEIDLVYWLDYFKTLMLLEDEEEEGEEEND